MRNFSLTQRCEFVFFKEKVIQQYLFFSLKWISSIYIYSPAQPCMIKVNEIAFNNFNSK